LAKKAMSKHDGAQHVTAELGFLRCFFSPQNTNSALEICPVNQVIESETPNQILDPQRPNSTQGNDSCVDRGKDWQVSAKLGGLSYFCPCHSEKSTQTVNQVIENEQNSTHKNDSSSQTEESKAQSQEAKDPEIHNLQAKYKSFVKRNLQRHISDRLEAVFGWIYKLQDRGCQDSREVGNLELPLISRLQIYLQNVDGQILKLRKHLADLKMTTVKSNIQVIH
jgi:hypothetical protein